MPEKINAVRPFLKDGIDSRSLMELNVLRLMEDLSPQEKSFLTKKIHEKQGIYPKRTPALTNAQKINWILRNAKGSKANLINSLFQLRTLSTDHSVNFALTKARIGLDAAIINIQEAISQIEAYNKALPNARSRKPSDSD